MHRALADVAPGEIRPDGPPKPRIFISYSRKDLAFVDRLEAALKRRGFEPLIDRSEIYAFEDWWQRIASLIAGADTVVFVLSPDSATSEIALKEVAHAGSLNKRFAPIVYRAVPDNAVPETLRRLNFIFFDDAARFEDDADKLAEALQTDIGWIRQHTEFGEAAGRWLSSGRPHGLLLRSPALEQAEHWIAARPPAAPRPTQVTEAFIVESRKGEDRTARRTKRVKLAIGLLAAGVIATALLSYRGWLDRSYLTIQARRLIDLHVSSALPLQTERSLRAGDSFTDCASCPEMIVVPAGTFIMGSTEGEGRDDERPHHPVVIARPFAVSKFEVTFDQWDACVAHGGCSYEGKNESWGRGRQPMIRVSWNDANAYAAWLSRQTGKSYRLLTEAEWEYVARAGSRARYSFGEEAAALDEHAWYSANSGGKTNVVGGKKANRFGLHDMSGNVWEWVQDCYVDTYVDAPADGSAVEIGADAECGFRVLRGGSWFSQPEDLRVAARYGYIARFRNDSHGFRVARTLSIDPKPGRGDGAGVPE